MTTKQPMIRLRKTDMPMSRDVSLSQKRAHRINWVQALTQAQRALFDLEGEKLPGITPRQMTDLQGAIHYSENSLHMGTEYAKCVFKKLLNLQSHGAPWTWETGAVLRGTEGNPSQLWNWTEDPGRWKITLPDLEVLPDPDRKTLDIHLTKSRLWRSLLRYCDRLNIACITRGIPGRIHIYGHSEDRTGDGAYYMVTVQAEFCTHWLKTDKSYKTHLNRELTSHIPAYFMPELAVKAYREDSSDLVSITAELITAVELVAPYSDGRMDKVSSGWMAALINEGPVDMAAVCAGNEPIPPSCEIFPIIAVFDHLEALKGITKTMMRLSQPYDHISFLPSDS